MYGTFYWIHRVVRISTRQYSSNSTKKLLEFLAKMPKANTGRIAEAQRQRKQIAKKSEKYGPSTVYLQVLGSGARGVPNTLYLFTDQKRYLFNCGECTQRLAHEHKVKLSRLEHIFITSKTWGNIGGLPGLSLTLQDVGVPNITLHGPEGLDELYNATRRFVVMKEMNVNMAKCTPAEDFEDNAMTVKYVLLGPHDILQTQPVTKKAKHEEAHPDAEFEEFIHDDTDYYRRDAKHSRDSKNKNTKPNVKLDDNDSVKKKTAQVLQHLQKTDHCSVAYICTIKKRPGTLDLEKCVERGVKPGPLLGQLKSGQDVVLPDGTVVYSADVKTPDDPGPVFIVLEVPDISYLREDEFSAHFDNGDNPKENIPALIVHYTPPHILHHDKYRAFMAMFGKTTKHLVLNSMNRCLGSEAVHRSQHKLSLLDTEIFPLLRDSSIPAEWGAPSPAPGHAQQREIDEYKNKIATAQFQNIINGEGGGAPDLPGAEGGAPELLAGRTLAVYHLRPKMGLDRSTEPKLHIQDYSLEAMSVEGFADSLQQFRELVESARLARPRQPYPRVVFLGTGSCIPSKTRNTSAILLQVDETRSMLLDCGEGTFGQLVRLFGPERVNAVLRTLHAVYVSHLHADHHIGLIGVLQARREAYDEVSQEALPVYLLAPGQIVTWLAMYDQQFQSIRRDFTLVPNQNLLECKMNESHEAGLGAAALAALGLQRAVTCLVPHCPNAFGLALQLRRHKITYSGDTMPCEDLVRIGEDSTLLIHEATMEDELAGEARQKMHSTTSQAVEVGRRMRAQFTLLTHFSQRYARLPRLDSRLLDDRRVGIAFDNMQICMDDLELLPHMYAPLQLMFAEHCVELEQKAAQRARRTERRTEPRPSPPELSERGRSPADSTQSAPQQRTSAQYRHTNASRLRFEMLNKASVAERTRSKSHSPGKCATRVSVPTFKKSNTSNKIQTQRQSPATGTASNVNYVHVIDSRSKTLSTAATAAPVDRWRPSSARARNISSPAQNTTYTCITRKSDLNKIGPRKEMVAPAEKKTRSRLQSRYVKEEKNPAPSNSRNVASPRQLRCTVASTLYHLLFWRLHHVISQMSHLKWQLLTTIIALGYLFWTAFNASRTGDRDRGNLSKAGSHRMKYTAVNKNSSPARTPSTNRSRIPIGINNLPKYNVETNAVSSNKGFKPQLEDIKSSFLLLNENKDNVNIPPKKEIATPKPKVLNETWRRLQLIEAKKKFKRKQFWNDSKFLNIDGLNWIPWK